MSAQDADLNRDNRARHSRRKKKKKQEPERVAAEPADGAAVSAPPDVEYSKPQKRKKRTKPKAAPPVCGQQASPTLTRINISAQPGTSVSITPGGPQPGHHPTLHNTSKGSVETEI